jgi:hypothetical protein
MNKGLIKKGLVIWIIAIFATIYINPVYANETIKEETFTVEYNLIDSKGILIKEKVELSSSEIEKLKDRLLLIIENLKLSKEENELINVLESYLDFEDYPFLSRIIEQILSSGFSFNRDLIFSQGWGYNFNLLKKTKVDFIKSIYFWRYTDSANPINMPSSTAAMSMNPFQVKTFIGNQMGFMLGFRGAHIQIARSYPMGSFTIFLGSARHVGGFEITPLSSYINI